ncbi:MAG: tyrosine-type recombinase/integrase [Rhodobacteraceae bacterium]|nr:tyrosine-type recombinase/integrase [Paracoccaceae bacterium]
MRNFNAQNERFKRKYIDFIKETKGRDHKTLGKVTAALVKFEESTKYKPFKAFHIDQARQFKNTLDRAKNPATGKPLSLTTIDATLRMVKGFFQWLAWQQGFKKVLSHGDAEYFNNNAKDARAAHSQRPIQVPSIKAAYHAFQAMPEVTELQQRDKAIFAFLMLTGARVSATATLKLKHINLIDGTVFQDGREVDTKNSKVFMTTFFPVDPAYLASFTAWVKHLINDRLFGPEDALFPKPEREFIDGKFAFRKVSHEPYANSAKINMIVRQSFANVQLPEYTSHSFRSTLSQLMSDFNLSVEEQKAWSQNLGHKHFATTVSHYMKVSEQKQVELIAGLKG